MPAKTPNPSYNNPMLSRSERPLPTRVGIVGAGTIGPDIAYYLLSGLPQCTVVLVDVAQSQLDRAVGRIHGYVDKGLERRKLSPPQAEAVRANLLPTLDYGQLAGCQWVIEAATEQLELKRRIFAQLETVLDEDALITSNTSSLPAARMFGGLTHKRRATVTHFFAPAFQNPAVEVIAWDQTDPEVVDWLRQVFASTGKVPLVTQDVMCFMLDRVFDNWCNDAALLLSTGATAAEIDSVSQEFVHAGPFFVLNLARGNPIIVETNTLQMEESDAYRPADILKSVDTWNTVPPRKTVPVARDRAADVRDRMLGVLFSQSFDILDRSIATAADLELGCQLALGFKQGPLDTMRALGAAEVARIARRYDRERPGTPGPRQDLGAYQAFARHVLVDSVAVDGGEVVVLTIRRPAALNALDDAVTDELLAAVQAHEARSSVRGFVITGYGTKAFCAGADIGRFPGVLGNAEAAYAYAVDCSRLLVHLDQMDKPVVAALNGLALGGGLELALRCHSLVSVKQAFLQFPEVTLGIAPGIGGMSVPYRRWPTAAAVFHDMLRLAKKLSAPEAFELGVLDALADDVPDLLALAIARVNEFAGKLPQLRHDPVDIGEIAPVEPMAGKQLLSAEVVAMIEEAIRRGAAATSFGGALEVGYQAFGATACTAAATEGVTAFIQKRRPDFATTG